MQSNNLQKRKKIAVTGGYASGKTSVLSRFVERGYFAVSADDIYHGLLLNEQFVQEISTSLDIEPLIINNRKTLDKKSVSSIVFGNPKKLELLNSLTHKTVYEKMLFEFEHDLNRKVVFEIPLLFESGRENEFDIVIIVMRNCENRIKSGALRDNISELSALARIKNQFNYDKIAKDKHTLIYNDGCLNELFIKVDKLIDAIESQNT